TNSGVSIAEDEYHRVFDKFYRIPSNDPWKYGGTGLGLALIRKLVESIGSSIRVSSTTNTTTFTVSIPCSDSLNGSTPMAAIPLAVN
ncbi:MAG: ATP-binding protein, partial [Cyanobacteria bacterium J06626_14]